MLMGDGYVLRQGDLERVFLYVGDGYAFEKETSSASAGLTVTATSSNMGHANDNVMFMGDGYENGEPHWQIRDDGRLMFSVMVDDSQEIRHFSELEQRMVTAAGLHRVYYTEPIWDISKSGKWFHLAAVYDPIGRRVSQYVDGQRVSEQEISDKFHISKLRIGPAEIGNWGQPFRKPPCFPCGI